MATVGAFEAKTHFASLLERAAKGEEIVITRHGTPVAKLTPVSASNRERRREVIQRLKEFSKRQTLGDLTVSASCATKGAGDGSVGPRCLGSARMVLR